MLSKIQMIKKAMVLTLAATFLSLPLADMALAKEHSLHETQHHQEEIKDGHHNKDSHKIEKNHTEEHHDSHHPDEKGGSHDQHKVHG